MHVMTINEKKVMPLKERKQRYMEGVGERKGNGKLCNYFIIPKK